MQSKLLYTLFITLISTISLYSLGRIDSLMVEVERMENTSEKIYALIELADSLKDNATIESVKYAQRALSIAEKLDNKKAQGDAYYQIALSEYYRDDYENAKAAGNQSIQIFKTLNLAFDLAKSYYLQGNIFAFEDNLDSAQYCLDEALPLLQEEESGTWQADVNISLGMIYNKKKENPKAITYLDNAIETYSKIEPKQSQKLLRAYILKGIALNDEEEYEATIDIYQKALEVANEIGDIYNGHICKTNLGWTYQLLGDYDNAEKYCTEALATAVEVNNVYSITECNKCLGVVNAKKGNIEKGENFLLEGLQTAQEANLKEEMMEVYNHLTEIFEDRGDYKKALDYFRECKMYSDTAFQRNKSREIATVKKELNISNDTLQEKLADAQTELKRWRWFGSFLILGLISSLIYLYSTVKRVREHYRKRITTERETYQLELSQVQDELEKFTYAASHDLKEPMRNIMSFAGLLHKRLNSKYQDTELAEYSNFIIKGARQMYDIIIGILEFSAVNTYPTQLTSTNLKETIDSALISIEDLVNDKNAVINIGDNVPECIITNESYLRLIFKYLIENSITYNNSEQPTIDIKYLSSREEHIFRVKDNGIGIEEKYHDYIFNMFKRIHSRETYQGTGMGLSISKKLVEALEGTIKIESSSEEGSTFVINFPIIENSK